MFVRDYFHSKTFNISKEIQIRGDTIKRFCIFLVVLFYCKIKNMNFTNSIQFLLKDFDCIKGNTNKSRHDWTVLYFFSPILFYCKIKNTNYLHSGQFLLGL